jgi:hypothetical protein
MEGERVIIQGEYQKMEPGTFKMLVRHSAQRKHLEESDRDQPDVGEQACSERD